MHDLRRQALESAKTTSRKAKSRQASGATSKNASKNASPAVSPKVSRAVSRDVSDDEGDFSDTTNFSTQSIDELISPDEVDDSTLDWLTDLNTRMNYLIERKGSNTEGREANLSAFSHILMAHYAQNEMSHRVDEIVTAILKSVKAGQSEDETILALKAISMIVITVPSDNFYDLVSKDIKRLIHDSEYSTAKTAAIHTLGVTAFYGGASVEETQSVMTFFLEIVESDGTYVDAADDATVVTAALEEWGTLATQLDDMEDESDEAIEIFLDQLDASHVDVQVAAGENIALLYEKSWTPREEDEDPSPEMVRSPSLGQNSDSSDPDNDDEEEDESAKDMVKRYTPYRQEYQLRQKLTSLASASSKRVSKKDRKSLHNNFSDILHSVQHPTRGPRYNSAISDETGKAYGSRLTVGVGKENFLTIKTWEQLFRLKALRRILQSGFLVHYSANEVVFDTLPVMLQNGNSSGAKVNLRARRDRTGRRMLGDDL